MIIVLSFFLYNWSSLKNKIKWVKMINTISYVKSHLSHVFFYCFNYKMTTKQLNIKNRTYYFYDDLINVLNFEKKIDLDKT